MLKNLAKVPGILLLVLAFVTPVHAGAPRTLSWEDLTPPMDDLTRQFDHLSDEQLSALQELHSLGKWRQKSDSKAATSDSIGQQIGDLSKSLESAGLDVNALVQKMDVAMTEYERRSSQPVNALDGIDIRLPGYVLPLEFNGTAVSEFFLVPYVGACIHTPPPSANQIVLVRLNQSYNPEELYEAVWITGKLRVVESEHQLRYRDGTGAISTTYQMDGVRITPYE